MTRKHKKLIKLYRELIKWIAAKRIPDHVTDMDKMVPVPKKPEPVSEAPTIDQLLRDIQKYRKARGFK